MKSLRHIIVAGIALGFATAQSFAAFSYFDTFYNTDFASVGIGGMRGVGSESLTLSGVSGTVTGAYIFWHGPTRSSDLAANATVNFAGTSVTGTNIGQSQDNNWGYANSQSYRADVTSLVTGDGTYALSNFVKNSGNINVNGVSLYVTYDDGVADNNRDLVLFNGNDSNISSAFDPAGWSVGLNGINYTSGEANLRLTISDGQNFGDDEGATLNGILLYGTGPTWQGALGTNIVGNGSLWDEKTFAITSFLTPGLNNLSFQSSGALTDALGLIVAGIDLPAGAAPPPPPMTPVPEPSTYGLFGALGLAGVVAARKRLKPTVAQA